MIKRFARALLLVLPTLAAPAATIDPAYSSFYGLLDLGTPTGVAQKYGGFSFLYSDLSTLLIGGFANEDTGTIYQKSVVRDGLNHITAFGASPGLFYAEAPYIDGGLTFTANHTLLYTSYSNNTITQILPGNSTAALSSNLTLLGVGNSTGGLGFVPPGVSGSGNLLVTSYGAQAIYNLPYTTNPDNTLSFGNATLNASLSGVGPEQFIFVAAGTPGFATDSILIADVDNAQVLAYALDGSGNLTGNATVFISGLDGVEGAAIDPLTGDFLFNTFGNDNTFIRVSAIPEPSLYALGLGAVALIIARLRRKSRS